MKLDDLNIYAIGDTIQMAGVVYSDATESFLAMFPGERPGMPIHTLRMDADEWKRFLFQTDVLETQIIEKSADGTLAKAIVRKSQRHIDQVMMWKVWKRDGYACRYCGKDDVPLTVDHLVCWEEGGPTVPENLVSACKKCNKVRGNLPYVEWLSHLYYIEVSRSGKAVQIAANDALAKTLPNIPRYVNRRSR